MLISTVNTRLNLTNCWLIHSINLHGLSRLDLRFFMWGKSQSIASTNHTTFWWALQTQTGGVIFEPVGTHRLSVKAQNFKNPIFTFGCFSLKAVYNSCKLQRLLQVAKFLFMYSFTYTNIYFLFTHLPTEIVFFINKRLLPDEMFHWW